MKNKNVTYSFEGVPDVGGDKLIITGITSSLNIKYVELEYTKDFMGKSEKTCRREIEKIKSKNGIKKRYWSRAVIIQGKTFVSRLLIEKRKKKQTAKKAQTLVEGYIEMLSKINWKIAGSVRFKWDKTLEENRKTMENFILFLNNHIEGKYTLFYVIEPNDPLFSKAKDPHHLHYMIAFDGNIDTQKLIISVGLHFLPMDKTEINSDWCKPYDPTNNGYIKYCANKIKPRRDNYSLFSKD